jgi:serine kinase of HPr protein (carbohydrate metabolism regulator)
LLVHASCVAINGQAILLRGPSGSGKSDLSLRLIDGGASLVADDQVLLKAVTGETDDEHLMASAPAALSGLLEVRNIGIVKCDAVSSGQVRLVIDLDEAANIERLPDRKTCALLGIELPILTLNAFEPSAPAKVRIALGAYMLQPNRRF